MMRLRTGRFLLLCSLLPGLAHAQQTFAPAGDSLAYRELAGRLASGDTLIDFTELRFLFAEQPRPEDAPDPGDLFRQAEQARDQVRARELVDSALVHQYGNVSAHQAAYRLFSERGDSGRAEFHRAVVRGFIRSMEEGGADTANGEIPVISVAEEYALLRERGLERLRQALSTCGEYRCDVMNVRDPESGEEFTLVFLLTWWRDD